MSLSIIGTLRLVEVVWIVTGVPGLVLWLFNLRTAQIARRAVKLVGEFDEASAALAGTVFRLTLGAVAVELVFIVWGVLGLFVSVETQDASLLGWIVTIGIVFISLTVFLVGFDVRRTIKSVSYLSRAVM